MPLPRLAGRHQLDNAGGAIATASVVFGDELTMEALEYGLTHAEWPARLERLPPGALYSFVDEDTEIWLDGGHNAAGGQAIAHAVAELDDRVPRPVHLIWGMMETKDAHAFVAPFKGLVERVYTVPIPEEQNAFDAGELAEVAASEGFTVTAAERAARAVAVTRGLQRARTRLDLRLALSRGPRPQAAPLTKKFRTSPLEGEVGAPPRRAGRGCSVPGPPPIPLEGRARCEAQTATDLIARQKGQDDYWRAGSSG